MTGICAVNLAAVSRAVFSAASVVFPAAKHSRFNQVNFVLDTNGFFAHLYVTAPTLVVDPDFVHATPFETLAAALAGTATMTPLATIRATDNDAILRSMKEPFVVIEAILSIYCLRKTGNTPRISRYAY
jgi:hypothetical protein